MLCVGIFLNVLVGGDGGAAGPKELMGWVGSVTHGMAYPPPTPRFTEVGTMNLDLMTLQNLKRSVQYVIFILRVKCEEEVVSSL